VLKKVVTTYAKSLFQNVNSLQASSEAFAVSKITALDQKHLYQQFILLRRVIVSSFDINFVEKIKRIFSNPTYAEQQKLDILLSIFPGLTVTMKSFLKVLTERTHLSLIPEISDEYTEFY
jgi:F0F1-type ATP synthase delta subunit